MLVMVFVLFAALPKGFVSAERVYATPIVG